MKDTTKENATKMEVMHNGKIIGKLLVNNKLMVLPEFILELKPTYTLAESSPSLGIKDSFDIMNGEKTTADFIEFTLPINMIISIETSYNTEFKKYSNIAIIREKSEVSEFPTNN